MVSISPVLLHRFDLKSCFKSLEQLSLRDFDSSLHKGAAIDEFVNSFNSFKSLINLRILSIIGNLGHLYKLNGIEHLKRLRYIYIKEFDQLLNRISRRTVNITFRTLDVFQTPSFSYHALYRYIPSLENSTMDEPEIWFILWIL